MGSGKAKETVERMDRSSEDLHPLIEELKKKHREDLQNLTLTKQPFRTISFFIFATLQYLRQSLVYILRKGGWLMVLAVVLAALGPFLLNDDGSNEKHIQELINYARFGLWWMALGVASSIGLGSGLHTFVLYLGPHIALFTIKAMQCGRVDIKSAPYDTIQLERGPSWLEKDCSMFGPPLYKSLPGSLVTVPISSILPQVQIEAVLWGLGTALGELPPYFISRAARLSGSKIEMEELAPSSKEDGVLYTYLKRIKFWFSTRSQHLNFFTILVLASVPNPLFDLAGIMCGQFGIPFWKFFLATLIGKALIKAHIQTFFVISLFNNQLLDWVENKLIWVLDFIPGLSSLLPALIAKLHMVQKKYLSSSATEHAAANEQSKRWKLSLTTAWNAVIWFMLANFFLEIVTATARRYLQEQQERELTNKSRSL